MPWKPLIAAYCILPFAIMFGATGAGIALPLALVAMIVAPHLLALPETDAAIDRQIRREAYLESASGRVMWLAAAVLCAILMVVAVTLHA